MNTAIKYANENGIEALRDALPASCRPALNESIVVEGIRINLADAFEVLEADKFVENYNVAPCLYADMEKAEIDRYFEVMKGVEA